MGENLHQIVAREGKFTSDSSTCTILIYQIFCKNSLSETAYTFFSLKIEMWINEDRYFVKLLSDWFDTIFSGLLNDL